MTFGQKVGLFIILSFVFYTILAWIYERRHPGKAGDVVSGTLIVGMLFAFSIVLLIP